MTGRPSRFRSGASPGQARQPERQAGVRAERETDRRARPGRGAGQSPERHTVRLIVRPERHTVRPDWRSERGAGSLMVALVGLAVAVVAWLVLAGSAFVVAHHRAEAVADGAALAGARAVVAAGSATGAEAVACDSARAVAAAQQAYLDDCQVVAFDRFVAVTVQVSVATPLGLPGLPSRLEAVARAGNPGG